MAEPEAAAPEPEPVEPQPEAAAEPEADPLAGLDDLDALLASLNADAAPTATDGTEADLDALLASLK
jgi:hypothetical protein